MSPTNETENQALAGAIEEKLTPIITRVMDGYGLAGLAIGIVRQGEVLYARGFGQRTIEMGTPVTARSLFHLASVSKSFVSTAVMQLWEQDRVDLDAPVTEYLPYFALQGGPSAEITPRQLLSHTGGVPDPNEYDWHQPQVDEGALERYVRNLAHEEMIATPGARYAYSNPAFEVLGDLIAKVAGQPFESYVKHNILEPLGMRDSTFLRAEVASDLATTPHFGAPLQVLPGAYPYNRAHAPSSTLHASAAEMCRWMLAHLAHGELDGHRILRTATYNTLWQTHAQTGEDGWSEAACLGWFQGTYRDQPVIHHGGSDPGYFADLILLPEIDAGVMVMANAYCATAWGISDAALDLLLGREPALPKRPITVPVGAALAASDVDAAVAEYRRLRESAAGDYDFAEARFRDAIWGAVELYRAEVVMPLLQVWLALFPDSADVHEWLGRAYLASGDRAAAAASLQTAQRLAPENEDLPKLLQRIDHV